MWTLFLVLGAFVLDGAVVLLFLKWAVESVPWL